jgi:uncharacterized RmlC-like cupin family protein
MMARAPIELLLRDFPVKPLREALQAHPELWNQRTERTAAADSPHHGLDDIWCRYADPATVREDGSHESVWYPPAEVLPVRPMVFALMTAVWGERLGGVLITRIPAGARCKPHVDEGWHARTFEKFAVSIDAAWGQRFCFNGYSLGTRPGDVFWFDNSVEHWVENESDQDRVTLICCIRTERTQNAAA